MCDSFEVDCIEETDTVMCDSLEVDCIEET